MSAKDIKELYVRFSLIAIILILGLVIFTQSLPFLGGILGAFTVYILLRKQMFRLTEEKKRKKSLVATLLLLETILCILIPVSLIAWFVINQLQGANVDINALLLPVQHIFDLVEEKTGYNLLSKDNLSSVAAIASRIGQALMGGISSFGVNILVLLFVLYFMLIGGRDMEKYITDILPFHQEDKTSVTHEINMIVTSNAIAIPLLAIIQGVVAMLGYYLFGAPNPLLLGVFTCFATIIPIVGTALVWVPTVVYLAVVGQWGYAIGLLLYAVLVITNIDNLARFILQKKMADIHPLITIFGVIIGISLFGFIGVIFGPLLLSLFLLCVNIFKKQYLDNLPLASDDNSQ